MKKPNIKWIVLLLNLSLLTAGCYSLKTVNDYAGAATSGLASFNAVKVSFTDNYRNAIKQDNVEKHNYKNRAVLPRDLTVLFAPDSTINQYQQADAAVNQVVTVLKEYFAGLGQLSNSELISFDPKFESLGSVLQDSNTLHLSSDQTSAYKKLINFIGNAAIEGYRRKKMTTYIEESYEPVKILLATLQTLTGMMKSEMEIQQSQAFITYSFQVNNADELYLTRLNLARGYVNEYESLTNQINQLAAFSRTLAVLQKSHQQVYEKRNKWDKKELRKAIMANLTELRKIKSDFDKLK